MNRKVSIRNSGKRKQRKPSALAGDSLSTAGGERHQVAGGAHSPLTTNQGVAISDNQDSLRANPRGPWLLDDFISLTPESMHMVM